MCGVVLHRVTASGSFGVFWFVRCGGGGCRVWFWSFPALPDLPDDDCGGLTQAAPKQERDAAGMESTIFPTFAPIYRRRPYCVSDFGPVPIFFEFLEAKQEQQETRNFENFRFGLKIFDERQKVVTQYGRRR